MTCLTSKLIVMIILMLLFDVPILSRHTMAYRNNAYVYIEQINFTAALFYTIPVQFLLLNIKIPYYRLVTVLSVCDRHSDVQLFFYSHNDSVILRKHCR